MITNQGSVLVTGEQEITTSVEGAPVNPFAGVTLTDPTPGATDTVAIYIAIPQGTLTDGSGYSGLSKEFFGTLGAPVDDYKYTLPAGTPAQVSAELDALVFTPSTYSVTTNPMTILGLVATSSQPNNSLATNPGDLSTSTDTQVQVIPTRSVSINPLVTYNGDGNLTLTGSAQSVAGVTNVEITAAVNGTNTDLGPATLNADGTFSFTDAIGSNIQGFITATETDAAGGTVSAWAGFSLQGGLSKGNFTARQTSYTPDGNSETAVTAFREDGSRRVNIMNSGVVYQSSFFDTFINHGAPDNTFVFTPNHGLDVVSQFRVNGVDHDTLSFQEQDFGNSIATVLANTTYEKGGAVIVDPTTGDTVKLLGITKAQLVANQGDFTFHT